MRNIRFFLSLSTLAFAQETPTGILPSGEAKALTNMPPQTGTSETHKTLQARFPWKQNP